VRAFAGPHKIEEGDSRECVGGLKSVRSFFPRLSTSQNGESPLKMVSLRPASSHGVEQRPLRLGVVLSGGQAPGGHNVIIGLHDYLQRWHPGSTLVGFLSGPRGVMRNDYKILEAQELVRGCCWLAERDLGSSFELAEMPHAVMCTENVHPSFALAVPCALAAAGCLPEPRRLPLDLQRARQDLQAGRANSGREGTAC
jgi:hypothetical protein